MKRRSAFILFLPLGMFLLLCGLFIKNHVLSGALVGIGTIVMGIFAAGAVPLLVQKEGTDAQRRIDWRDERNNTIREKAAWYAGMITMVAMSVSALVLALIDQIVGACVIAGLLLLYSFSILSFSAYFSKRL